MSIDITKYQKNKDLEIKAEDFDLDKLEADLTKQARKGYMSETDHNSKLQSATADSTTKYGELEGKYNTLEKTYNSTVEALNNKNTELAKVGLEKTMMSEGFKEENFEEISKLRTSMFGNEKDDKVAIQSIKEKFSATYFPKSNENNDAPNEGGLGGNKGINSGDNSTVKITRKTSIRDLIKKS